MSMFRIQKDKDNPYVMLNKKFLNDVNLSWKAKGLLSYLLSLPDDWQIYENELIKHSTDKRDSTKAAIKELIDNGYIERERVRDELGRLKHYEYRVYEVSIQSGKSNIGESTVGETPTTNNNLTHNNSTKKENIYIDLPIDDNYFLRIYNYYFHKKFGKNHMKVSEDQLSYIEENIERLKDNDIYDSLFAEVVEDYFNSLASGNNGNILSFIKGFRRYFDINPTDYE